MINGIQVGNAPCSWGTLEFADTQGNRIECDTVLDELVETGFTGCELGDWGFMPTEPDALYKKFSARGLALTGAFVPVALKDPSMHKDGLARCLKVANLIKRTSDLLDNDTEPFLVLADDNGADAIRTRNAGRVQPSMGLSTNEWAAFTSGANHIARVINEETGLRTVFHHHCAGFIETPDEIDRLLDGADAEYLGLVFDTGHYSFGAGGCDTVTAAMDRYADRIWYVHFKDFKPSVFKNAIQHGWDYFDAVKNGIFCELGDGCVDFPAVLAWLVQHDYSGYVTVEQDVLPGMGSPYESAKRGREYLASIGL